MSEYRPEFDLDRLNGEEAERYVRQLRCALGVGEIEVKRDNQAHRTGNIFIEYACRSQRDGAYHPSGLATTKATTWALYIDGCVVFVPVWVLKLVAGHCGERRECTVGSNPTRGVVVPVRELLVAIVAVMHGGADREARAT